MSPAPYPRCEECGQPVPRHPPDVDPERVRARAERILARLPVEPADVTSARLRDLYEASLPPRPTHAADGTALAAREISLDDLRRLMPGLTPKEPT